MKQVHALLCRQEKLSVTQAVVVVFHIEDTCTFDDDDLLDELKDATTEWARRLKTDGIVFGYAGDDMNIGDIAASADLDEIAEYAPNIRKIEIIRPDIPADFTYDTSLCNDIEEDAYESSS